MKATSYLKATLTFGFAAYTASTTAISAHHESGLPEDHKPDFPTVEEIIIEAANGDVYAEDILPQGAHSYFEFDLDMVVSYIRIGSLMYGSVHESLDGSLYTCFAATIESDGVNVTWWNNLGLVNPDWANNSHRVDTRYSLEDFTSGNALPGSKYFAKKLSNPNAVAYCQSLLGAD